MLVSFAAFGEYCRRFRPLNLGAIVFPMKSNLAQLTLQRKKLLAELSEVRLNSMRATHRCDFRAVGRLTLEAAVINQAISDVDVAELFAL